MKTAKHKRVKREERAIAGMEKRRAISYGGVREGEDGGGVFIGGRRRHGGDKWMAAAVTEYVVAGFMKRRSSCHAGSDSLVRASTDHC